MNFNFIFNLKLLDIILDLKATRWTERHLSTVTHFPRIRFLPLLLCVYVHVHIFFWTAGQLVADTMLFSPQMCDLLRNDTVIKIKEFNVGTAPGACLRISFMCRMGFGNCPEETSLVKWNPGWVSLLGTTLFSLLWPEMVPPSLFPKATLVTTAGQSFGGPSRHFWCFSHSCVFARSATEVA